jgi:hypothetical protein
MFSLPPAHDHRELNYRAEVDRMRAEIQALKDEGLLRSCFLWVPA